MGAVAMRISLIKRSASGFIARACLGSSTPSTIAAAIAKKDLESNIVSSPGFVGNKRLAGFCSQDSRWRNA